MTTSTSMTNHLQTAGPKNMSGAKGANERPEEYIKDALLTMGMPTGGAVNKLLSDPVEHLVKKGKESIDPTVDDIGKFDEKVKDLIENVCEFFEITYEEGKDLIEKGGELLEITYKEVKDLSQIVKYRIEVYIEKGWDILELAYETGKELVQKGMDCIK